MEIRNTIRKRRKELGYSQGDMAKMCRVSVSHYGNFERGVGLVIDPMLYKICEVLELVIIVVPVENIRMKK